MHNFLNIIVRNVTGRWSGYISFFSFVSVLIFFNIFVPNYIFSFYKKKYQPVQAYHLKRDRIPNLVFCLYVNHLVLKYGASSIRLEPMLAQSGSSPLYEAFCEWQDLAGPDLSLQMSRLVSKQALSLWEKFLPVVQHITMVQTQTLCLTLSITWISFQVRQFDNRQHRHIDLLTLDSFTTTLEV